MNNIFQLRAKSKQLHALVGAGWVILGLLGVAVQPAAPAAQAHVLQQVTLTPTRRLPPKTTVSAVTEPSPKVDGVIGGQQVKMKANLPSTGQGGVPFFGDLFKFTNFDPNDLDNGSRAIFVIQDSNGNEVYRHTENNQPFCLFGNPDNRPCNNITQRNGFLYWPASDGRGEQEVQPGRYSLSASIEDQNGGTICNTSEDFAFDINVQFEAPPAQPGSGGLVLLPASAGAAGITAPGDGLVWQGVVTIRGTATLRSNFSYYKFEFEDPRCGETGGCFVAKFSRAVRNGVLLNMDTRKYPNGNYLLRLMVVDRQGRVLTTIPRISITIQN